MTYFGDTFYFIALLNPSDAAHGRALAFAATSAGAPIVTTEWVLTELADGMNTGQQRQAVIILFQRIFARNNIRVIPATHALFREGWDLYSQRPDKEWSLTDCTSFIIMQREGITEALTADHHFEQAGFTALLK